MIDWTTGERLYTRGHAWTLCGVERGIDCAALHLAREPEPAFRSTLLSPFDRFVAASCVDRPKVVPTRQWYEAVKLLAGTSHPAGALRALPTARIKLLPHQLEPALAVVRLGATRILIADAVGLGKTIQAGLIAAELGARQRSIRALILVPAGLRDQWAGELSTHFALQCVRADASWLADMAVERSVGVNPWALPGMFLASFDFVKRPEVLRPLEDVSWDLLVLDEAHAASAASDRRVAAHAIATRARTVVLLTATPPADDPAEYHALCNIGRIDAREGPVLLFRRTQANVELRPPRKSRLLMVRPSETEVRMHHLLEEYTRRVWFESRRRNDDLARLAAIVLRKRALSSAASLLLSVRRRLDHLVSPAAPEVEQLRLQFWDEDPLEDAEPAALAAPGLADASLERRWLSLIAESAQRAARSETKLRFLRRLLARLREPAVVFTEYRDTLLRLRAALADGTCVVKSLHGGMSPSERTTVQRDFNTGIPAKSQEPHADQRVVLLATDAAAEGLNLHERCRVVIHFELPWSTSRLEQRAGRVDRFGQARLVHEAALVSATRAEGLVLAPLMRRAWRARTAGLGAEGLSAALPESQVADLILGDSSRPIDPVRSSAVPVESGMVRMVSLESEAIEEVSRARTIRSLLPSIPDSVPVFKPQRPLASVVKRRRSELPTGTILVYLVELYSKDSPLHRALVALRLPPALHPKLDRARDICAFLDELRIRSSRRLIHALSHHVRLALDLTARVKGAVDLEWRQRTVLMQRGSCSAATQLVQQRLFERRTARTTAVSGRSVVLPDDSETTQTSSPIVAVDVQLVAALIVS